MCNIDKGTETDEIQGGSAPGLWGNSCPEARSSSRVGAGGAPGSPAQASPGEQCPREEPSVVCVHRAAWVCIPLSLL